MGNFIGQALFGWMFPHPAPASAPASAPTPTPAQTVVNNTSTNNPAQQYPYQAQQFNSTQHK